MLISQKEERSRRFSLALRAGIPILLLVFLVFYTTLYHSTFTFSAMDGFLLAAVTFISIYFIYFLIDLSVSGVMIDETTQSFNKKTFAKKLNSYNPKMVACLNIENLNSLSENYSSEQIDSLLYTVAHQLNLIFKQNGLNSVPIGRYRGSEFLIALNENRKDIEDILNTMAKENRIVNGIEISYKFAIIQNVVQDFEQTILQLRDIISAEENPVHQKKSSAIVKDADDLSDIEKEVINRLKNKNLLLSFRPLINTKTEIVDTYEIAIKLKSDKQRDILPRVFLPIINRLGLGREYDLTLLTQVIALLPLVDKNISFTFNLSPFSLRDKGFQERFFQCIIDKNIDPSRLIIQLYERKTHHDLSRYLKTLNEFRTKGIKICIDNFGSSNASMEYLKHFKFDMIQFDRDYVTNLDDKTTNAMLVSLVNMSKELQVKTVVKWVDNDKQKEKLIKLNIDYMQGFGIGKVLSEYELIEKYN